MNFGEALRLLKDGKRVARSGWNGKGMFAYLVPAASYPVQTGAAKAYFGENAMVPYRAYLALKTADDDVATWAPSCSDVLADDWTEVAGKQSSEFKTTRVASEKEVGIDEPVETGGHDIDRDGPIPFDG